MKFTAVVLLTFFSLNAFAVIRADCKGRVNGQEIDLKILARGSKMQLKSSALGYGNLTSLKLVDSSTTASTYEGTSNCNSQTSTGAFTEKLCPFNEKVSVEVSNAIAEIAKADFIPLGESFSLKLVSDTVPSVVLSCKTTIALSRTL